MAQAAYRWDPAGGKLTEEGCWDQFRKSEHDQGYRILNQIQNCLGALRRIHILIIQHSSYILAAHGTPIYTLLTHPGVFGLAMSCMTDEAILAISPRIIELILQEEAAGEVRQGSQLLSPVVATEGRMRGQDACGGQAQKRSSRGSVRPPWHWGYSWPSLGAPLPSHSVFPLTRPSVPQAESRVFPSGTLAWRDDEEGTIQGNAPGCKFAPPSFSSACF